MDELLKKASFDTQKRTRLQRVAEAEQQYEALVESLQNLTVEKHPLLDDSKEAFVNRSLLLDRAPTESTTWNELFIGRLRFDLLVNNLTINLQDGERTVQKYVPSPIVPHPDGCGKFYIPEDLLQSVLVILQSYDKKDRNRFYNQGDLFKERSVAFMFGLRSGGKPQSAQTISKRLKGMTYKTIRSMLDMAIELAKDTESISDDYRKNGKTKKRKKNKQLVKTGGKVTEQISTRVYKRFTDPLGEKLHPIDTSIFDTEVISTYETKFSEEYLDGKPTTDSNQPLPKVIFEPIPRKEQNKGTNHVHVAAINNVLSKNAVVELVNLLNKEKFVKGAGGNKEKTFVRVSSLVGSPFMVSEGKTVYDSVPFGEVDYLLKGYFEKLMAIQTKVIEKAIGRDFKQTVGVNTIHMLVGHFKNAKYVWHSDFGCYLCTDPNVHPQRIYAGEGVAYLPTREEQQTYTIVICLGTKEPNSKLTHRETLTCHEFPGLSLHNIAAHIQFAGTQEHWLQHGVEAIEDSVNDPGAVRIVLTARLCTPRNNAIFGDRIRKSVFNPNDQYECNWIRDYCYTNVINRLQSLEADVSDNSNADNGEGDSNTITGNKNKPNPKKTTSRKPIHQSWINITSEAETDRYRKLPKQWFDNLAIQRPPSKGTVKQTLQECLADHRFAHTLFRAGILVETSYVETSKTGTVETKWRQLIPRLPKKRSTDDQITLEVEEESLRFLEPSTMCNMGYISQLLDLQSSEIRRQPYNQSNRKIHGIMCSQPYKNMMDLVIEELKHFNFRKNLKDEGKLPLYDEATYVPYSNPVHNGKQGMNGWGGSPTVMGSNAPTPSNDSKEDAGVIFPIGQGMCIPKSEHESQKLSGKRALMMDDNMAFFHQYYLPGSVFLYFWDELQLLGGEPKLRKLIDADILNQKEKVNNKCRFVNYMVVENWTHAAPDKKEVIREEYSLFPSIPYHFLWFRMNRHNKITMVPFFSDADYALIKQREEDNEPYKLLKIPHNSNTRITFGIPAGSPHKLFDIKNEDCIYMETIYQAVANSNMLDQFWVNKEQYQNQKKSEEQIDKPQHSVPGTNQVTGISLSEDGVSTEHGDEDETTLLDKEQTEYEKMTTENLNNYNPVIVDAAQEALATDNSKFQRNKRQQHAVVAHFSKTMESAVWKKQKPNIGQQTLGDVDLDKTTKQKGTSMTYRDTCLCGVFTAAAVAYRYMKKGGCLISEKPDDRREKKTSPLKVHATKTKKKRNNNKAQKTLYAAPLMVEELGVAQRVNAHPAGNRYMDALPVHLRREAIRRHWIPDSNRFRKLDLHNKEHIGILVESFIAATILRFTGRVSRFASFQQWSKNTNNTFLPTNEEDITLFLEYVERTVMGRSGLGYMMTQWLNGQHFEAIPKSIRNSFVHFKSFVQQLLLGMPILVELLVKIATAKQRKKLDKRNNCIKIMCEHIRRWCTDDSKGNIRFLAQQILADVEGLFGFVFGQPEADGITPGHAGDLGYIMLVWKLPRKEKPSFSEVLQTIVDGVHNGTYLDDNWLEIAGYKRQSKTEVVNIINGLPFCVTDAEHWLCKSWVLARKTFNHYRNSMYPVPLEPYYHPIRYRGNNLPDSIISDKVIDYLMDKSTRMFERWAINEPKDSPKCLELPEVLHM